MKLYLILIALVLGGCNDVKSVDEMTFSTSAMYPPFEYGNDGDLKGFDIDLGKCIAQELGKKAVFKDMQFSAVLQALASGQADAAIATITITEERQKNFDLSDPYYFESMAAVFKKGSPVTEKAHLVGKKVACQLGTTMEIWLKKHAPQSEIIAMDNTVQAIEALKAGHADVAIMDGAQGNVFSQKNPGLTFTILAKSENGYGIALKKGSALLPKINEALKKLQANGTIKALEQKWLGG